MVAAALVLKVRLMPLVPLFVRVTVASGITAPLWSTMVPVIVPAVCAGASLALQITSSTPRNTVKKPDGLRRSFLKIGLSGKLDGTGPLDSPKLGISITSLNLCSRNPTQWNLSANALRSTHLTTPLGLCQMIVSPCFREEPVENAAERGDRKLQVRRVWAADTEEFGERDDELRL